MWCDMKIKIEKRTYSKCKIYYFVELC